VGHGFRARRHSSRLSRHIVDRWLGRGAGGQFFPNHECHGRLCRHAVADRQSRGREQRQQSESRQELTRLLTSDFRNGAEPFAGRSRLYRESHRSPNRPHQTDADKRVNDVVAQVKADLDKARKAAMHLAIWLTLSLFIGAFSAALGGHRRRSLRDGTWGKKRLENIAELTASNTNERNTNERRDHADSSVASWNTNPADHPDHAAATTDRLILSAQSTFIPIESHRRKIQ